MTEAKMKPEWSHEIDAEEITSKTIRLTIEPDAEEVKALCQRLDLHDIQSLQCVYMIQRNEGNMVVHIQGTITAKLKQKCVVTLEPVAQEIHEEFEAWYADDSQAVSFARAKRDRMNMKDLEDQPILEEQEDPEPIIDGKIDLGEVATQFLSLALAPYPRAEGVEFPEQSKALGAEPDGVYDNPFAALKNWRKKDQ